MADEMIDLLSAKIDALEAANNERAVKQAVDRERLKVIGENIDRINDRSNKLLWIVIAVVITGGGNMLLERIFPIAN